MLNFLTIIFCSLHPIDEKNRRQDLSFLNFFEIFCKKFSSDVFQYARVVNICGFRPVVIVYACGAGVV